MIQNKSAIAEKKHSQYSVPYVLISNRSPIIVMSDTRLKEKSIVVFLVSSVNISPHNSRKMNKICAVLLLIDAYVITSHVGFKTAVVSDL